ncbi:DUF6602 domain-containing protein [Runella aurantiaca]|uniref:DUF6602 domain-containing protein n=1 Tax=Runella aurantiaca TaxID=2282308 RepID=A0A369I1L6_9BACT|nr:DUF6602 domain-containing protein [Runella aurantiaca]RDB02367.1 hypothetical protein DVG78_29275 [Runella aurantiaca]
MGNRIIKKILEAETAQFRTNFSAISKDIFYDPEKKRIFHNGEFGSYREKIVKDFLKQLIPQRFSIGTGFIVNSIDEVSTQCDLIFYDFDQTPLIKDSQNQTFFPAETVGGIIEVKSVLNYTDFKKALNKMARNKMLRNENNLKKFKCYNSLESDSQIIGNPFNDFFSCLVCNKLTFDPFLMDSNDIYEQDIPPRYWHNLILSVDDGGLLLYRGPEMKLTPYPILPGQTLAQFFYTIKTDDLPYLEMYEFAQFLFLGLSGVNLYIPELYYYLKD